MGKVAEVKQAKQESIRKRILITVLAVLITSLVLLGIVSVVLNILSINSTLKNAMKETAEMSAQAVAQELQAYKNVVAELGSVARMSNESVSDEDRQEIIQQKIDTYGFIRGKLIGVDGIAMDGTDYNDRAYFQASMRGETYITEPMISKTTGALSIMISAPVWKGGIPNTEVMGVVFMTPVETFLNDIVEEIKVSKNGSAYIIDANGNTIAHKDMTLVETQSNTIKDAQTDSSLKAIAKLESNMIAGETGAGSYTYGGVNKLMSYAPIPGTNGWSIAVTAPMSDFMSSAYLAIALTLGVLLITVLAAVVLITRLANGIGNPIHQCADRLALLAKGDLSTPIPQISSHDETGILAGATEEIVSGMRTMIEDIKYVLGEMSEGNFDVHTREEASYVGEFAGILQAMRSINTNLTETLQQIQQATDQVNMGAEQMAEGAQSLAEGATDQAAAVEELLATVEDLTARAKDGTGDALQTSEEAKSIGRKTRENTEKMSEMTSAMSRITDASRQIETIIKSIEDIASQTNLLSLNASIEAARAGEAGRGFAVVAGEIGQLANESAVAADKTKKLIATALSEVENGNAIVDRTSAAMDEVITGIDQVVEAIGAVAKNSEGQLVAMQQINTGIDQISNVVQSNSATAQESSATSEELSAQATSLKQQISIFKLKKM